MSIYNIIKSNDIIEIYESIIFFLTNYLFLIPLLYYERILISILRIKLKVKES
jgi:hypothetical protein